MKSLLTVSTLAFAVCAQAQYIADLSHGLGEAKARPTSMASHLTVKGAYITGNRQTGEMSATGGVEATAAPFRFMSDRISRSAEGVCDFGSEVHATTCSNEMDHLHWELSTESPFKCIEDGSITFNEGKSVTVKNAWLRYMDVPVLWVPFWYYPLDTSYGWRLMPGYTSRWGGYLLSGYVYNIVNEGNPDAYSLGGSTYADYRTKNGFAVGQTVRWGLKEFGHGKVRFFHAWDQNYDRYDDHMTDHKHHYNHWGSEVDRERYRVTLEHEADFTERDAFRAQVSYLSDSHLNRDFFQREHREDGVPENEMWYEHRELSWATGVEVSGPVNNFYGGTARLPEAWIAVQPQPVWDLPVNYESKTRVGYLNRDYARYGRSTDPEYYYNPYIGIDGSGADYQAFRADTYHRLSAPMKFADVLSFVPRTSYRGTYWSDSGDGDTGFVTAADDAIYRHIWEIGATLSARASGWLNERWRHTVEPYVDYSFQVVNLNGDSDRRYYVFDSIDRSTEWLDQFDFEGRGLPYNWHGIRPGVRNLFQQLDDNDMLREVLDLDIYAAIPFETGDVFKDGYLAGYAEDDEDGNYSANGNDQVVPGTCIRFKPSRNTSFHTRTEYDTENEKVAYSALTFQQVLTDDFRYYLGYIGRDHRKWDYLPSNVERWNYELANILQLGFTHKPVHFFSYSPYIRHDCRRSEVEEVGMWFDILTDCIGYRVNVSYEDSYKRIDGSKEESEVRVAFYLYLRAMGPSSSLDLIRF